MIFKFFLSSAFPSRLRCGKRRFYGRVEFLLIHLVAGESIMGKKKWSTADAKSQAGIENEAKSPADDEMKFKSAAGTNVADGIATAAPPAPAGGKKAREPKRTKIFLRNLSEDTTSMV
jgi:hypothetical protein